MTRPADTPIFPAPCFQTTDSVYLVFSANKSGEYFGYARMTSEINEDPAAAIEFAPKSQSAADADLPKAIPTEATEFAPRGRIIDDSARGTIFWEIERDENETSGGGAGGSTTAGDDDDDDSGSARSGDGASAIATATATASASTTAAAGGAADESKAWGKPFKLEWQSTARLPFYRTRGLRNPWNSNREVKIARDGTELEPSVGRRLISLFAGAGAGAGGRIQSPTGFGPASAAGGMLPMAPPPAMAPQGGGIMPGAPAARQVPGYPPSGPGMRSPQPYHQQ